MAPLKSDADEKAFAARLNRELEAMGVVRPALAENLLGSVGKIGVNRESGTLVVTTAVGIHCQYDTSAYVYKFLLGQWRRVWESEQDDYSPGKYLPQHIDAVHILQPHKEGKEDGTPVVMTLGNDWGCASTWHSVYYRVWRTGLSGPKLLIDGAGFGWLRAPTYIVGSVVQNPLNENAPIDVLVEFTTGSIDAGVHNREAVRHYLIDGDQVRRVDPVALSPRDFVDEWLTARWSESVNWSASPALEQWHRRLHSDSLGGEFGFRR